MITFFDNLFPVEYTIGMNKYTCSTLPKAVIVKEYIKKPGASITTASAALGITRKVFWRSLKTYGIKAKSKGRKGVQKKNYIFDVDSFKKDYFKPGATLVQYAKKIGISYDTLWVRMKEHGIQAKPKKGSYYKQKTEILSRITKEDIERAYFAHPKTSLEQAAVKLGVERNALSRAIKKLGMIVKPRFRTGEDHPNWNGGSSYHPDYPWSFKLIREKILSRDSNKCINCQKSKNLKNHKRSLSIHHIDYNKHNSDEKNLVSLCDSCHSKTNYNRKRWIPKFQKYINNLYKI